MGYIYKVVNNKNGKVYIGQTKRTVSWRWYHHCVSAVNPNAKDYECLLHKAIRKYGEESFSVEAVESVPAEQLNERELYWINYYDSYNSGYNMTLGGGGFLKCTDEELLDAWNAGYTCTEIAKILKIGINIGTVGKRLAALGIGEEEIDSRKRQAVSKKVSKPIYQYTCDGDFVAEFSSAAEAAKAYGFDRRLLSDKGSKCVNGFQWRKYKVEKIPAVSKRTHTVKIGKYDLKSGQLLKTYETILEATEENGLSYSAISNCLSGRSKSCGGFLWKRI